MSGARAKARGLSRYAESCEPSTANAHPWRVVRQGNAYHLFEEHKDGLSESEAAIKELDLGIFCAHLEQSALELGLAGQFERMRPDVPNAPDTWHYHISFSMQPLRGKGAVA